MKKRDMILTITLAAMLLLSVPARAQLFLDEESMSSSLRAAQDEAYPDMPLLNMESDQLGEFAPLGGGVLVLGCLGGAYLLGKRRISKKQ